MNLQLVDEITKDQLRSDVPTFKPGDTLKVYVTIQEGNKSRVQLFEGVCIARKGSGISETFTVRKISYGVGVERVFPVYSPRVVAVEIVKTGKVRRSKLYYIRDKVGKGGRIKELLGPKANARIAANRAAINAARNTEKEIHEEQVAAKQVAAKQAE